MSSKQICNQLLKVPDLVSPLRKNPDGILQKCDDNKKSTNGGEMRSEGLGVDVDPVLHLGGVLA